MRYIKPIYIQVMSLFAILVVPNLGAHGEMQLLHREMFVTSGTLNMLSPGNNFSEVLGNLHMRAGGPRLPDGAAASADLRESGTNALGRFHFSSTENRKIFIGAWFFIKEINGNQADVLGLSNLEGVISPLVCIRNGKLTAGIHIQNEFYSVEDSWQYQWVYLGIAVHLKEGSSADLRFYRKELNGPLQPFAEMNNANIGIDNLKQMFAGSWTFGTQIKGRMGAPSAYTFEEDNFSDVVYPIDLIEPSTRMTWYCDPTNGNDDADGTSPEKAWKSAAKINEESRFTGIFPAASYQQGDLLIIDTTSTPLDLKGESLTIATHGLNLKAPASQDWIQVKAFKTLQNSTWQPTGIPNVYSTNDTQNHIVLWENDKWMNHPVGATIAAVSNQLSATPGSFWTDGNTLYVHPFGSTDPRSDQKRYERSYFFVDGSAMLLAAPNLHIEDIHLGKTCLAGSTNNDAIGAYCVGLVSSAGNTIYRHSYLYYGSKHNFAIVAGGLNDDVLIEDVQCEQGSPYVGYGSQTVFVSFNGSPHALNITHRYHNCRTIANAGLIGSTEGAMVKAFPVFYVHNVGNPGDLNPFTRIEFIDCDFGNGDILGGAVDTTHLERTRCGYVDMYSNVTALESWFYGMNTCSPGKQLKERSCIHVMSGQLRRNQIAGTVDIQGCTFDASLITEIQGGVPESSLFTRIGSLSLVFHNNLILMPSSISNANVFAYLSNQDSLELSHNAYHLSENLLSYQYDHDGTKFDYNLTPWQSIGFDVASLAPINLQLDQLRPTPGSPLINAGKNIGPMKDHTGVLFTKRNDIGAFEAPPTTYEDWQSENFTSEELEDPGVSSSGASYLNDGYPNLLKYALGVNASFPLQSAFDYSLAEDQGGAVKFDVTLRLSVWPTDISLHIESSTDLTNWHPAMIDEQMIVGENYHERVLSFLALSPSADSGFLRLIVQWIRTH